MKVSPSAVVNAIPNSVVEATVDQVILPLRAALIKIVSTSVNSPSARTVPALEQSLFAALLEAGQLLEKLFNSLEKTPDDRTEKAQMVPGTFDSLFSDKPAI